MRTVKVGFDTLNNVKNDLYEACQEWRRLGTRDAGRGLAKRYGWKDCGRGHTLELAWRAIACLSGDEDGESGSPDASRIGLESSMTWGSRPHLLGMVTAIHAVRA